MNVHINGHIAEMEIDQEKAVILATGDLIWSSQNVSRAKFKVKKAFKGLKLSSTEELSTIAVSATLNRDIQFIELTCQSIYCPVDKLVIFESSFDSVKEKIKLKSKLGRFHYLKGVRLSGSGIVGLAYQGKFDTKQLKAGESIQIGVDYLLAVYASKESLAGSIVGDTLYKVLVKDGYDGRVTVIGPAVVYYQSEKVTEVEKII